VNILYKQTANNSSISKLGKWLTNPQHKTSTYYEMLYGASDLVRFYSEYLNINVSTTFKIGAKIFYILCHMIDFDCVTLETKSSVGW
jgi:hypothetical protein